MNNCEDGSFPCHFKMASKDKKTKKKGKTMALTDFLSVNASGTSFVYAPKPVDWAAEMEEAEIDSEPTYMAVAVDRTKLPTAPKASRGPDDLSKIPTEPPFTAFVGNLPYETTEEKIKDFFHKLSVLNVRIPDDGGRMRGIGYVEFESRQDLIDAMSMNEETLGGRKLRIDLADEAKHGDRGKGGRGGRDEGGPDRTEGNWRSAPPADSGFGDRGGSRYDDRGPSRGGGFDDRGGSRYNDRGSGSRYNDRGSSYDNDGFDGGRDRDYGRNDDRGGFNRYDDRGGRDDRGFGSRDDRGGRDDRGFGGDRRGGSFDRRDDRYGSRDGGRDRYDDRGYGGGRDRDRYDRDGGGGRRGFGSGFRRDERDGDQGGSWERGGGFAGDRDRDRGGYDRDDRYKSQDREPEAAKERPRFNLQPRTKPIENIEPVKEKAPESKPQKSGASIFGGAKPVDTAQREREIEERLIKRKTEPSANKSSLESRGYGSSRGYEEPISREKRYDSSENKENRNVSRPEGRRRSGSDRSEDDDTRHRRSSGSSKKKGSFSSSRSRQDSGDPSHGGEVFSGSEDGKEDKSYNAISPAHRDEPVKLVPAPPPKENIWEKRKSTQAPPISPGGEEPRSPTSPAFAPPTQSHHQPSKPAQHHNKAEVSVNAAGNKDVRKEFVPAEPPKENPWTKRRQEQSTAPPSSGPRTPATNDTAPPVHSAWAARGGSHTGAADRGGHAAGDRGRGRGRAGYGRGRGVEPLKKHEKKEKPFPHSIDEMPKLESKKDKDFSDNNKFAGLVDDDGGDYEEET